MNWFIHLHPASTLVCADPDSDADSLHCATVVLQHPNGPVGFDRGLGHEAIRALVHDVVVVERMNSPAWFELKADALSSPALHSQFSRVTTCTRPLPGVLQELETVSCNRRQARKNDLLARHGKPQLPLASTLFDDWIAPNGLIRKRPALSVVNACQTFVVWSFADWGLFASVLGRSAEEALEPVIRAAKDLNASTRQVQSESDLPTW
jgi:hypothetical protein